MVGTRILPLYDEGKGKRKGLLALLLIDLKAEKGLTIVTLLLLQCFDWFLESFKFWKRTGWFGKQYTERLCDHPRLALMMAMNHELHICWNWQAHSVDINPLDWFFVVFSLGQQPASYLLNPRFGANL